MADAIRLAKYIADSGVCSRRAAARLIDSGRIKVNGELARHAYYVTPSDTVLLDETPIAPLSERAYFAFNKPIGVDCRLLPDDPTSLYHYLPKHLRLYPIGRLDKDSHGLLFLTNDGAFCHALNHPTQLKEKEYLVTTLRPISAEFCHLMASGVEILQQTTRPCRVWQVTDNQYRIILTQGLNRQIRRMTKACGNFVIDLKRERIASVSLNALSLPSGEMIELTKAQISE